MGEAKRPTMICITFEGFSVLLRFAVEGSMSLAFLVGLPLCAAIVTGFVMQRSRERALLRLLAATDAYAELEIARDPHIPAREFMASFVAAWTRG
jgi:hypothetical protein